MVQVGEKFVKIDGPITRDTINKYAKASGDRNPMHTDDEFAAKVGLKGVIAHGMLSFGYGVRHMNDLARELGGKMINVGCEMRGSVRPGDTIITTIEVKAVDGNTIELEMIQNTKLPLHLEKDGQIVKVFEGEEREWVKEKEKGGIATEATPEGTLTYREWLANRGWGKIKLA